LLFVIRCTLKLHAFLKRIFGFLLQFLGALARRQRGLFSRIISPSYTIVTKLRFTSQRASPRRRKERKWVSGEIRRCHAEVPVREVTANSRHMREHDRRQLYLPSFRLLLHPTQNTFYPCITPGASPVRRTIAACYASRTYLATSDATGQSRILSHRGRESGDFADLVNPGLRVSLPSAHSLRKPREYRGRDPA